MRTTKPSKMLIIAHRGASAFAPENTLRAFRLAMEAGADGIELDVQMTRDGMLVVTHDEKIDRVSDGIGSVSDYTYDELCKFNFSALYPNEPPERIPTLREVYELVRPSDIIINVELKQSSHPGFEQAVLCETAESGIGDRVLFSSFDHYSMRRIKKLDPSARVGLLYSEILFKPWRYAHSVGAEAVHPRYDILLIPGMVKKCREHGVMVNAWTVDDEKIMRLLIKKGVNALITNQVEKAILIRDGN